MREINDLDILACFDKLAGRARYMHIWDSRASMMESFGLTEEDLRGTHILLAAYEYQSYDGDAFVVFIKDGKLWEVDAGHCSCYGLENGWRPEETSIEGLRWRIEKGRLGGPTRFAEELLQILKQLEGQDLGKVGSDDSSEGSKDGMGATKTTKAVDGDRRKTRKKRAASPA